MPAFELGGSQRRQLQGGVQRRAVVAEGEPALEQRRKHHDAVDNDALISLKCARGLGGTESTITFAEKKFWRAGTVVLGDIKRNCLSHGVGIAGHAPEILADVSLGRPTPASADRVNQNEIGKGQPGTRIVAQGRACGVIRLRPEIENAWTDQAKV